MGFRSFFAVLSLLHRSFSLSPSPARWWLTARSSGGPGRWCPLKTTPTCRPESRALLVKGESPKPSSREQKKDHENTNQTNQTNKQNVGSNGLSCYARFALDCPQKKFFRIPQQNHNTRRNLDFQGLIIFSHPSLKSVISHSA